MARNPALYGHPSGSEPVLDQKLIVQAALDLLNEVGLDALSMRRLAEKLNIKAASLYWHVRDKEHLLILLADRICAAIPEPDPALPWRKQLEIMGREVRRVLLAYRDGARVMAETPPLGPNRLRLIETLLSTLLKAGFNPKDAAYAGFVANDYVTMFVVEETRFSQEAQKGGVENLFASWNEAFTSKEYPTLQLLADDLLASNADERFLFGLNVLLDGLEMHLTRSRSASS